MYGPDCAAVCVFMCVSNGSVTGRQWAVAAGFPLMKAVSIYLLLNISAPRWIVFLFSLLYVEASNSSVYCGAAECTVHTNRVLYSSLVVYRMIVIYLSLSFLIICFC